MSRTGSTLGKISNVHKLLDELQHECIVVDTALDNADLDSTPDISSLGYLRINQHV